MFPFTSNHFAPHTGTTFEGYYSKFRLSSGASVALIISTIPGAVANASQPFSLSSLLSTQSATRRGPPHLIIFAYVGENGHEWYLKEWNPKELVQTRKDRGFSWSWENGHIGWDGDENITWKLDYPEVKFTAYTSDRVPWDPSSPTSTPAGFLADLPLPIQWHVHSTHSTCNFSLSLSPNQSSDPSHEPPISSDSGAAHVHVEKNWAHSFPFAYIWIQSRAETSGLAVAGGSLIPGVEAFLVGYTTKSGRFISFKPPTSASIFSVSLGLTSQISYPSRTAELDIRGWFTRLTIVATAPGETFFPLSAPLNTGHSPGFSVQSFGATIQVKVYRRRWWGWEETDVDQWEGGSLEFGGGYYKQHTN